MGSAASMSEESPVELSQVKASVPPALWTAEIEAKLAAISPLTLGDVKKTIPAAFATASGPQLTPEEIASYKETFDTFDTSGDGTISSAELFDAMKQVGMNPTQAAIDEMISNVDCDGSRAVDFPEFLEMMKKLMAPPTEQPAPVKTAASGPQLTPEEIASYKETFDTFDTSGDGTISSAELFDAMKQVGMNPTQASIDEMISNVDGDGSRAVDFPEFLEMMKKLMAPPTETEAVPVSDAELELLAQFSTFDADGSGSVTFNELKGVMKQINPNFSEEELKKMMKYGDKDGDGRIDYKEFVKLYT